MRSLVLCVVPILTLATLSSTPAPAADYYVTTTLDSADGTCDTHCSLREAVIAANGDAAEDVIHLGDGTYGSPSPGPTRTSP